MLELEENQKELELLKTKLESLGESLWHCKQKNAIKSSREKNIRTKFLEW